MHWVITYTLSEENASVRVSGKLSFTFVTKVIDPEDGHIWKRMLEKSTPAAFIAARSTIAKMSSFKIQKLDLFTVFISLCYDTGHTNTKHDQKAT